MANSIALAFYTVKVREARTNEYVSLGQIGQEDFLDFLDSFLQNAKDRQACDEDDLKVVNISSVYRPEKKREINGIMKTGEFGHISELVGARDGEKHYDRKLEDAELIPLYYLFYIPQKGEQGIAAFQRFKNLGVYSAFRKQLNKAFSEKFHGYILEMFQLVSDKFINRYLSEGKIKAMHFNQFGLPNDIADALKIGEQDAKHSKIQISVRARRGNFLRPDMNVETLAKKESKQSRKLVQVTKVDYSQVSLEMTVNGKTRKISIDKSQKFRPYYDVTNEVEIGENSHPKFESINKLTHDFLADFLNPLSK